MHLQANKTQHEDSSLLVLPVLNSFLFRKTHVFDDVYPIFLVTAMHVFSFGFSKVLKEYLINMVGDDERATPEPRSI